MAHLAAYLSITTAMPGRCWVVTRARSYPVFDLSRMRTTVTVLVQHSTQEYRDAHINSGMENGMQEAMDHLEQVARSLR